MSSYRGRPWPPALARAYGAKEGLSAYLGMSSVAALFFPLQSVGANANGAGAGRSQPGVVRHMIPTPKVNRVTHTYPRTLRGCVGPMPLDKLLTCLT